MATSEVIRLLGEPHSRMSLRDYLKSAHIIGFVGIEEKDPRMDTEYWLYSFDECECRVTVAGGVVTDVAVVDRQ